VPPAPASAPLQAHNPHSQLTLTLTLTLTSAAHPLQVTRGNKGCIRECGSMRVHVSVMHLKDPTRSAPPSLSPSLISLSHTHTHSPNKQTYTRVIDGVRARYQHARVVETALACGISMWYLHKYHPTVMRPRHTLSSYGIRVRFSGAPWTLSSASLRSLCADFSCRAACASNNSTCFSHSSLPQPRNRSPPSLLPPHRSDAPLSVFCHL
jgi:hypothetical protein